MLYFKGQHDTPPMTSAAYLIAAYNPASGAIQMIDPCGLTPGTVIRNLMALREQGAPTFVGKQFKVITNR